MKHFAEFYNDKGNVRPAARSEAKNLGFEMVKSALEAAGYEIHIDGTGSFYVTVGDATGPSGTVPVYLRLDNAVTTVLK